MIENIFKGIVTLILWTIIQTIELAVFTAKLFLAFKLIAYFSG